MYLVVVLYIRRSVVGLISLEAPRSGVGMEQLLTYSAGRVGVGGVCPSPRTVSLGLHFVLYSALRLVLSRRTAHVNALLDICSFMYSV
jgi:hypothetical protein